MIVIAYVPAAIAFIGGLLFSFSKNAKVSELGRLAYACGLIAFCFAVATHVWRVG